MSLSIPIIPQAYVDRLQRRQKSDLTEIWDILDQVKDPEIPVLSIWDLGVLCDVQHDENDSHHIVVTVTPTYSGCPAMDMIRDEIMTALEASNISNIKIKTQLAPAWTTDWISPEGRKNLSEYGIAPPTVSGGGCEFHELTPEGGIECPHCGSSNTVRLAEFGSTACKALFKCNDCCEPFDYFKNI